MNTVSSWLIEPITKHYFDFEGRATRQTFWMFMLVVFVVALGFDLASLSFFPDLPLGDVFLIAVWLPTLAISARRLHDIGMSGWWQILGVPLALLSMGLELSQEVEWVAWFLFTINLVMFAWQGKSGPNQYGADPRVAGVLPMPALADTEAK